MAFADEDQVLEIPDIRGDLTAEDNGSPNDGRGGDPDDGLDAILSDEDDAVDADSLGVVIDQLYVKVLFYLASQGWLVP